MDSELQEVHLSAGAKVVTCFWSSQATSYLMERSLTKHAPDAGAVCDISNIIKAVTLSARTVSPSEPQRR